MLNIIGNQTKIILLDLRHYPKREKMDNVLKIVATAIALIIAVAIINVLYQAGLNIRADRVNRESLKNHAVTEWRTPIGGCIYYVTPQGQYIPEFRGQGKELVCNKD